MTPDTITYFKHHAVGPSDCSEGSMLYELEKVTGNINDQGN